MRTWLRNIRHERPQEVVAQMAGITQQMYSAIELGERNPSVDVAKRIAAVLGFHWTRFFSEDDGEKEAI